MLTDSTTTTTTTTTWCAGLDVGEYIVNVSVTDGQFTRYADVRLTVEGISQDAVDSAVVVRLDSLSPEEFVSHHMNSFVLALQAELHVRNTAIKVLTTSSCILCLIISWCSLLNIFYKFASAIA